MIFFNCYNKQKIKFNARCKFRPSYASVLRSLSPGCSSIIRVPGSIVHADGRITYGGQAGTSIGSFPSGDPAGSSNPANRNLGSFPSGSSGTSSNPAIQKPTVGSAPSGGSVGSSNPTISNPGNPHVVATGASSTTPVVSSGVPSTSTPKLTNSDEFCLDVLDRSIAVQRLFNTNAEVLIDDTDGENPFKSLFHYVRNAGISIIEGSDN